MEPEPGKKPVSELAKQIFSKNLKVLMNAQRIKNPNQLSRLIGIHPTNIKRWLDGENIPQVDVLLLLWQKLGVNVHYLVTNVGELMHPKLTEDEKDKVIHQLLAELKKERAENKKLIVENLSLRRWKEKLFEDSIKKSLKSPPPKPKKEPNVLEFIPKQA